MTNDVSLPAISSQINVLNGIPLQTQFDETVHLLETINAVDHVPIRAQFSQMP
jgi:hypothetical protein